MESSSGAPEYLLAHIASISIAIDQNDLSTQGHGTRVAVTVTDTVLVPLLKRLQNGVIQLEREGRTLPSQIREPFVDLYPALFGSRCAGCTVSRVTYLACLQTLVKMNPKAFHADWPRLLGGEFPSSPTSPAVFESFAESSACSSSADRGLYVHLQDEAPKLRHAVAASISTLIEGPAQRAYLGMAAHRNDLDDKVKSFISLSEVLGRLVVVNVKALSAAIAWEEDEAACAAMVRAMTTFLVGSWSNKARHTTGGRIPVDLAWDCVAVLVQKVDEQRNGVQHREGATPPDTPAYVTSPSTAAATSTSIVTSQEPRVRALATTSGELIVVCLGSLASIFGAGGVPVCCADGPSDRVMDIDATLDVLVRCLARKKSTRIKLEAAAALRAVVRWMHQRPPAGIDDRERRRAADQSSQLQKQKQQLQQQQRQQQLVPLFDETKAILTRAKASSDAPLQRKENSNKERLTHQLVLLFGDLGIVDWELVVAAANHPAARIRSAAFSCFSGARIRDSDRDAYLRLAETHALETNEKESTVRSSAVKAYLEAFTNHAGRPSLGTGETEDDDHTDHRTDHVTTRMIQRSDCRIMHVIAPSLQDSVLAVRIHAAILAADVASTLWHSCMEHLADMWESAEKRQRGANVLLQILKCSILACRDHEKVAVHGFRALGFLTGGILRLEGTSSHTLADLCDEIVDVITEGMARGAHGKKELHWSCTEAVTVACMLRSNTSESGSDALCTRLSSILDNNQLCK